MRRPGRAHRVALAALLLTACQGLAPPPDAPEPLPAPTTRPITAPATAPPPAGTTAGPTVVEVGFVRTQFAALPATADRDWLAAWPAWLASCRAFARDTSGRRAAWTGVCQQASALRPEASAIRNYFATEFDLFRIVAETRAIGTGADVPATSSASRGLLTGYYEPLLRGSRRPDPRYPVALHRVPEDLVAVEPADLTGEFPATPARGRIDRTRPGTRPVPYWTRAELAAGNRLRGAELAWVEDPIEAFFLQVQGSGRLQLPGGETMRVAYADSNGHPYRSIGRWLVDSGELPLERASMQGIQDWARANPARLTELMNQNPRYVFFREVPLGDPRDGPAGALGVPLTAGYSVAVDPQFTPQGAPLLLDSVHPVSGEPLIRPVLAQDTGSAIRGPLRFDLFWGLGRTAGAAAGRQRHEVGAWLLVPRGVAPKILLAR